MTKYLKNISGPRCVGEFLYCDLSEVMKQKEGGGARGLGHLLTPRYADYDPHVVGHGGDLEGGPSGKGSTLPTSKSVEHRRNTRRRLR